MFFDFSALDGTRTNKLMTAAVVPRPIAWVVSRSVEGKLNAAPFSFFNMFSGDPPVVGIGIGSRGGEPKDTARNILHTHEFVINLVSYDLIDAMNVTAIDFPEAICELDMANIETAPSRTVGPPRIAGSPVALECRLLSAVPVGKARHVIIASVLGIHITDHAILDPERCHVDTPKLDLVARMHGGGAYLRANDSFICSRITLEEWTSSRSASQQVE